MSIGISRIKCTLAITIAVLLLSQFGCTEAEKTVTKKAAPGKPIFYPEPPDEIRMQFLTSFAGADVEVTMHEGGFDAFIMGDSDKKKTKRGIVKPYGINIFDGKIYVCDVGQRKVIILNPEDESFEYLSEDPRIINPVVIEIDGEGNKYVADTGSGSVFVFNREDVMTAILFKDAGFLPIDIKVRGAKLYIADMANSQVVVAGIDGSEILRFGQKGTEAGQFVSITGITVDDDENIYVTDKITANVTKFNKDGIFQTRFGQSGLGIEDFVRPKGIDIDREGRIWIVDTSIAIGKIYNTEHRLLLFFGMPGEEKMAGAMSFPVDIKVDYDNIEYFRKFAVVGADIEMIVLVSNQFGDNKISVYGYGNFSQ